MGMRTGNEAEWSTEGWGRGWRGLGGHDEGHMKRVGDCRIISLCADFLRQWQAPIQRSNAKCRQKTTRFSVPRVSAECLSLRKCFFEHFLRRRNLHGGSVYGRFRRRVRALPQGRIRRMFCSRDLENHVPGATVRHASPGSTIAERPRGTPPPTDRRGGPGFDRRGRALPGPGIL